MRVDDYRKKPSNQIDWGWAKSQLRKDKGQTGNPPEPKKKQRFKTGEDSMDIWDTDVCTSRSTESTSTCPHELLQQATLTLVPVVVSALVSAPRRSNTDVLWRPGREVTS